MRMINVFIFDTYSFHVDVLCIFLSVYFVSCIDLRNVIFFTTSVWELSLQFLFKVKHQPGNVAMLELLHVSGS